jgi:hypothetical protein
VRDIASHQKKEDSEGKQEREKEGRSLTAFASRYAPPALYPPRDRC